MRHKLPHLDMVGQVKNTCTCAALLLSSSKLTRKYTKSTIRWHWIDRRMNSFHARCLLRQCLRHCCDMMLGVWQITAKLSLIRLLLYGRIDIVDWISDKIFTYPHTATQGTDSGTFCHSISCLSLVHRVKRITEKTILAPRKNDAMANDARRMNTAARTVFALTSMAVCTYICYCYLFRSTLLYDAIQIDRCSRHTILFSESTIVFVGVSFQFNSIFSALQYSTALTIHAE